jgi:4-diphosphocytidyl-2-C-methyl-D-erythritol kinase
VRITVPSFAKTNWSLQVLGKRSDGYHEVLTVLQSLDFSDTISFEIPCDNIVLEVEGRKLTSGSDNLVLVAAALLRKCTKSEQGARIRLTKNIPIGAGLGGGSSNAAMTLIALNQLWDCGLSRMRLLELASELGSDVPFFIIGGTALGRGRGELITPFPALSREFSVLIYYPRFEVSAANSYSGLQDLPHKLTRQDLNTTIRRFHEVLEARNWNILRNELEGPVFSRFPWLAEKKKELFDAGCEFGMLSGSGSALFGVSSGDSLQDAKQRLAESGDADVILCKTLSRNRYVESLQQAGILTDLFSL